MKRVLLLASAVAVLAAPAVAQGSTLRGVVIAKEAKRHTVVVASRTGTVSTLRAGKRAGRARLGRLLVARVAKLPDGTYSAGSLRPLGRASHVHVSAVVVRRQGATLVLSGGNSVFTLHLRTAARSSADDGSLSPGDEVEVDADVHGGGLSADEGSVKEVGHTDKLELEGIYLSTAGNVVDVAIVHRGLVHVAVPDGLTLPKLTAGDEVALRVMLNADESLTLVSIENEESADSGGDGDGVDIDQEHSEFTVVGILASLTDTAASVKVEGRTDPVTCSIPPHDAQEPEPKSASHDAPAPKVGDLVEMHCRYRDGHFVLAGLRSKQPPAPDDGMGKLAVTGTLAAFDSTSVSVTVVGRSEPVTCALPAGTDLLGFAVGDSVQLYCFLDGGRWLLKGLRSEHAILAPSEGQSVFGLNGTILDVNSVRVSIQVAGHPSPVTCAVPAGVNLDWFSVGDSVLMYCVNHGDGFKLLALRSDHAAVTPDGAWVDLSGTIAALSSSEVDLTVAGHSSPLACTVPPGADLSPFAVGQGAEMRCRLHEGQFVLSALRTDTAQLVLEQP